MKKIIIVTMFVAFYASQINAQVNFGIKGGMNFANFNLKDAKNELTISNSTGWQAGALFQAKIPAINVGLQPELLYTVVKGGISGETNGIHYFQVPVNLRKNFLAFISPYIEAGPYFGYALKLDGTEFREKVERFDWGIGLGAGVDISKLQVGARYSWGLQDVGAKDIKLKNNTFSLSLALLF